MAQIIEFRRPKRQDSGSSRLAMLEAEHEALSREANILKNRYMATRMEPDFKCWWIAFWKEQKAWLDHHSQWCRLNDMPMNDERFNAIYRSITDELSQKSQIS